MSATKIQKTIVINSLAFVFVLLLELLSSWSSIDVYDSHSAFFIWQLSYTIMIMFVIWVNHYFLVPVFLDKKRYVIYALGLFLFLVIGTQFKAFGKDLEYTSKVFFFLIYTTGTGMAVFFLNRSITFQKESAQKDKLQKEMELNYLKEQVNPHFLFNSLNSIYSLSKSQSAETSDVVMQLSELMRYQLESAKKDKVSLREELDFIENYLLLEEKRLSERCKIELYISEFETELNIAPMLLIPFVENAVKHGAQATNKKSRIEVRAVVDRNRFDFSVVNSKPKDLKENNRKGIGLDNVKKRLDLLYANVHVLEILAQEDQYSITLSIQLSNTLKSIIL